MTARARLAGPVLREKAFYQLTYDIYPTTIVIWLVIRIMQFIVQDLYKTIYCMQKGIARSESVKHSPK